VVQHGGGQHQVEPAVREGQLRRVGALRAGPAAESGQDLLGHTDQRSVAVGRDHPNLG